MMCNETHGGRRPMRAALGGLVLALLVSGAALAQSPGGTDKQSDGRFTAIAIVTDNLAWHDLFRRPEPPQISGKSRFGPGDPGAVAIVFSNATPREGNVRVECDVTAFDPAGSSVVVDSGVCYEGQYYGDDVLHPVPLDLQFAVGPNDLSGRAGFEVTLRDVYASRSVELNVDFMQDTGK